MPNPLQVFVSSTQRDLEPYRNVVIDQIHRMDDFAPVYMEVFGARSLPPLAYCIDTVQKCDLFVGILGTKFGSSPPNDERSFTQIEFDEAKKRNKPRLLFEPSSLLLDDMPKENDLDKLQKLTIFQHSVSNVIIDRYSSPHDLARRVGAALYNWRLKKFGIEIGDTPRFVTRMPSASAVFVNREEVSELVRKNVNLERLVSLVGPPGIGKTELAKKVLRDILEEEPALKAIVYVDLQGASLPGSVISIVGNAMGLDRVESIEAIAEVIATEPLIILFDNLEWALRVDPKETRELIATLYEKTEAPRFLVTSRERIGLPGREVVVNISKLDDRYAEELIETLCEREGCTLTEQDKASLPELLKAVDGHPYAIVLASPRVAEIGAASFLLQYRDAGSAAYESLRYESVGARIPTSLHASIALSVRDLPDQQKLLLSTLSIFPSGVEINRIKKLLEDNNYLNNIATLRRKSLIEREEDRLYLLVPIREFAWSETKEKDRINILEKSVKMYTSFVADRVSRLGQEGGSDAINSLSHEMANINLIISELAKNPSADDRKNLVILVQLLTRYYRFKGLYEEGSSQIKIAKQLAAGDATLSARFDEQLSHVCRASGHFREAENLLAGAITRYQNLGLRRREGICHRRLSDLLRYNARYTSATTHAKRAIELSEPNDHLSFADSTETLADAQRMQGRFNAAEKNYSKAIDRYRDINALLGIANVSRNLAQIRHYQGQFKEANRLTSIALKTSEEIGDIQGVGATSLVAARVLLRNGVTGEVTHALNRALAALYEVGDQLGIPSASLISGHFYEKTGDLLKAREAFDDAINGYQKIDCPLNLCLALLSRLTLQDSEPSGDADSELMRQFKSLTGRDFKKHYRYIWPLEIKGAILHSFSLDIS